MAAILVAEIGDVTRFQRPEQLCAWAGLTPRHRESDTKVHRGRITKQDSKLVRWACVEAAQRSRSPHLAATRATAGARRGGNIAKVACARKLLIPDSAPPAGDLGQTEQPDRELTIRRSSPTAP